MCEGTYDDTNINLHIWSEENAGQVVDTGAGDGISASREDVIAGACSWAAAIAEDNSFHYGYGKHSMHNGCYFCGTQPSAKKKAGIKDYEKTYCCNPFVTAAFAHGGGDPTCLKMCRNGKSYTTSTFRKSKVFKSMGKLDSSKLEKGDALCWSHHFALYIGGGKMAEAMTTDDNVPGSKKWNNSIHVTDLRKTYLYVFRYTGKGGGKMENPGGAASAASDMTSAFTPKDSVTVLRTISSGDGTRYKIPGSGGFSVAQSFAVSGDKFAVAFTPGPETAVKGQVRLYDRTGKQLSYAGGNLYHANGSCGSKDGGVYVAGSLQSGRENKAVAYTVSGDKIKSGGTKDLPSVASSIAYDRSTDRYILSAGGSMTVYDGAFKKIKSINRSMHSAYYQDIGAGGGCVFCCHTGVKGGEKSGKNYVDIYSEDNGEYYGTYYVNYGELESADFLDGELVLLVHIKGSSNNYLHFTGITMQNAGIERALIDFRVTAKKMKISGGWDLYKKDVVAGGEVGTFTAEAKISGTNFGISGKLLGGRLRIKGSARNGTVSGRGYVEKVFEGIDPGTNVEGKATYVGVDDKDTDLSNRVLPVVSRYSDPYNNGFGGYCENWVAAVYREAGLPYPGYCCPYEHGVQTANKNGKIPKGAIVFSGMRRNGTMYENDHREDAFCHSCGHWAGHIAIYIGGGRIAGSQSPYVMAVDTWIDIYGYGGWSTK